MMRRLALAAALALAATAAAQAQQAGRYDGTSADGQPISITVANNPASGNFEIVSASVGYVVSCVPGNPAVTRTWSPNIDITAPRQKFSFYNGYSKIDLSIVFDGISAARGALIARAAFGTKYNSGGPRHVGMCTRPWQHYALSYAGP